MKKLTVAMSAVGLLLGGASSASAAVSWLESEANNLYGAPLKYGQTMLLDFDGIPNANVSYVGNVQSLENPVSDSAAPPVTGGTTICCAGGNPYDADPTLYASVQGGQTGIFSALNGYFLTSFSFYMGSPDTYNRVRFNYVGGGFDEFVGEDIWGGTPAGTGDRTQGYRVYYDFGGSRVSSIEFSSTQDAFEFDGLAGTLAVPEPGTWALMILGFGSAGAMLRSQRRRIVAA
nr:PEPxxWA-CTERM sorting domain-containing protein [Phenylobacterium kunshanense]